MNALDERVGVGPPATSVGEDAALDAVGVSREAMTRLLTELLATLERMKNLETSASDAVRGVPDARRDSARNLLHYLALRGRDLRPLQETLAQLGASSLGNAESYAMANVEAVTTLVHRLLLQDWPRAPRGVKAVGMAEGSHFLRSNTDAIFGPEPKERSLRIMVTMPREAADDASMIGEMLSAGMNCMRINCAHDGRGEWGRMIGHLRRAERELLLPCRVLMDLPGPKLRTGPLTPGPGVLKWKPRRDALGRVQVKARVLLYDGERPQPDCACEAAVPVLSRWLEALDVPCRIRFVDARGATRSLSVLRRDEHGVWAEGARTAYVTAGTRLRSRHPRAGSTVVMELPAGDSFILVHVGDEMIVTRSLENGRPAIRDDHDGIVLPGRIGCAPETILECARPGQRILFDDGKIGGVIRTMNKDELVVTITRARSGGEKLRSDKGINLPDTDLTLSIPTAFDLEILPFIADHADAVGLSFVREASEVTDVIARLSALTPRPVGVVLKIEKQRAFDQLPQLLLAGMCAPSCAVMVARGDLAIEVGYARLAELQQEILWVSEAAHVPAIWATQVLESLAKDGVPSRSEVTDAAAGERAECVMLNKGPHIVEAVRTLDDILKRMEGHCHKKRAMLRRLGFAERFVENSKAPPIGTGV